MEKLTKLLKFVVINAIFFINTIALAEMDKSLPKSLGYLLCLAMERGIVQ